MLWLKDAPGSIKATGKSGISQARSRLGDAPVRRLHDETVRPIATASTKGAWFKHWRLVSLDGSTLDVADEPSLEGAFGRPGAGHGESAFPQIRFVSLVENGTHVLFGTKMAGCATSEIALARQVLPALRPGMLCLADRNFFGFEMWGLARATGADLLWRVKTNARLTAILKVQNFPDSQIRRKMVQGWDAAFALPSVRSEGRMRDVSRHAEGARRQY
jgi:hypothetical protein